MKISVQSYSDVITNSSSSLFTVKLFDLEVVESVLQKAVDIHNEIYKKNDTLDDLMFIYQDGSRVIIESADDNSIPYFISSLIEEELRGKYGYEYGEYGV